MRRLASAWLLLCARCAGPPVEVQEACDRLEQAWSLERALPEGSSEAGCAAPEPRDLSDKTKLAVAVYHFNVQYVAGGLKGFPDGELLPVYNLDEAQVEDRIIKEGLEPVLDAFLASPELHGDIELQAYMVEIIARRHPAVLDKMRQLALRGQIDFNSFHYSDQLYVAYPRRDLQVSLDLTRRIFERACLPLGRSIFTQEGQFARGQVPIAAERGYSATVLPKNLFIYQMGDQAAQGSVLYSHPEAPEHPIILGGQSWQGEGFELRWTFMDDGEIAFSESRLNPYFGLDYRFDPAELQAHLEALRAIEAQGFVHATIAEATQAMRARGIAMSPLPPVLDGTWQPRDTNNLFRWMGGAGLFRTREHDSGVLSAVWRARTAVAQAEEVLQDELTPAWQEALLAQVSDSTGWNPFEGEIRYSFSHAEAAEQLAQDALLCAQKSLPPRALPSCAQPFEGALEDLGVAVESPARALKLKTQRCRSEVGELVEITVGVEQLTDQEKVFDESDQEVMERELEVRFELDPAQLALTFAFEEGLSPIALGDYVFEQIGVSLPNGLIRLGEGRYALQDLSSGRVAALLAPGAPVVRFRDETVTRAAASLRRYYLLEGFDDASALALAAAVNAPSQSAP